MPATNVTLHHDCERLAFHCPVTGAMVLSDEDETFETCTTPYIVAVLTADGRVYARKDPLPDPYPSLLDQAQSWLNPLSPDIDHIVSVHELYTWVPNVFAQLLPQSAVIFEVVARHRHHSTYYNYVVMDFSLPGIAISAEDIEYWFELSGDS